MIELHEIGRVSIRCKDHPEWGIFGVVSDRGDHYEIQGDFGSRVLSKSEFTKHWERVTP